MAANAPPNYRVFIPYGECLEPASPHAILDEGRAVDEADRTRLINLGENICAVCPQFGYCTEQVDAMAEVMWERGVGGVLVASQFKIVPAGEQSPVSAESRNFNFDLDPDQISSDPAKRLHIIRQAIRSGDLTVVGKRDDHHVSAVNMLQQEAARTQPDLYAEALQSLGPEGTRRGLATITNALMQLRLHRVESWRDRAARAREVISDGTFQSDIPTGVLYMQQLCEARELYRRLGGSLKGDASRTQLKWLPNAMLRHSSAYLQEIVSANLARYSSLTPSVVGELIYRHPVDIQGAIDRHLARQATELAQNNHRSPPPPLSVNQMEDSRRRMACEAAAKSIILEHSYLQPFRAKILSQPDPMQYANWLTTNARSLIQSDELKGYTGIARGDAVYFSIKDPKGAIRKLQRLSRAKRELRIMYQGNEEYTTERITRMSRQAAELADLDAYLTNLRQLEADPQNDRSVPVMLLHKYARSRPISYAEVKKKERTRHIEDRYKSTPNRPFRVRYMQQWMIRHIGAAYQYEELEAVTATLDEALASGELKGATADVGTFQPDRYREMAQSISNRSGHCITFADRLWRLEPLDRLVYAQAHNLDLLLYGKRINPAALEAALGTRDLEGLVRTSITEKIHARPSIRGDDSSNSARLGTLQQDLRYLDAYLASNEAGPEPIAVSSDQVQKVLDTVIGYLVEYEGDRTPFEGIVSDDDQVTKLMNEVRYLYAPDRQVRVIRNIAKLLDEGILAFNDRAEGSCISFSEELLNDISGIQLLDTFDLSVLAHHFEIDLLTHHTNLGVMIDERFALLARGQNVPDRDQRVAEIYECALLLTRGHREAGSDDTVEIEAAPDPLEMNLSKLFSDRRLVGQALNQAISHSMRGRSGESASLTSSVRSALFSVGNEIASYHKQSARGRDYELIQSLLRQVFGDATNGREPRTYDATETRIADHQRRNGLRPYDYEKIYNNYAAVIQEYMDYSERSR